MIFDNAIIIAKQVAVLFSLIGVGYALMRIRRFDDTSLRQINNILLIIINPCVIIKSFQANFDQSFLSGMLIAAISAIATHVVGAVISKLIFIRKPIMQSKVLQFAVVFSNCSFMCIPLLYAILGNEGVLYGSVYIAIFNILSWTYGIVLLTGNKADINIRKAIINPGTVSIMIALPLFLLQIKLPDVPTMVIEQLANLNTPIAMMVIGAQMAAIPLLQIFRDKSVYMGAFLRLVVVPGIMLLILSLFNLDRVLLLACLIPAMAPTAAATALFATRFNQDAALATKTIAFSTLASIVTMPLLILLSDMISQI